MNLNATNQMTDCVVKDINLADFDCKSWILPKL